MSERYLFGDASLGGLPNFPKYQGAMRALCLADDPWATRPAVELLCSGFILAKPEILTITPAEAGRPTSAISVSSVPSIATRCGEVPRNGSRRRDSASFFCRPCESRDPNGEESRFGNEADVLCNQ